VSYDLILESEARASNPGRTESARKTLQAIATTTVPDGRAARRMDERLAGPGGDRGSITSTLLTLLVIPHLRNPSTLALRRSAGSDGASSRGATSASNQERRSAERQPQPSRPAARAG
jgi:hypothetical protein